MTQNVEDMFRSICAERGGVDAMPATALAIARALAVALTSDPLVPATVAALTALLPPPVKPVGGVLDLTKLDDAELDVLAAYLGKAGTVAPPEPGSERAVINELLALNERLQAACDHAEDQARIARDAERMWRDMHSTGKDECDALRKRLQEVEARAWEAAHPTPAAAPAAKPTPARDNVVPLKSAPEPESPWAGLAAVTEALGRSPAPGTRDASDPSGRLRGGKP